MKNKSLVLPLCVGLLALMGAGCATTPSEKKSSDQEMGRQQEQQTSTPAITKDADQGNETAETMTKEKTEYEKTVHATYEPFTLTKYKTALAAHEPIFLYFYANWCPTCQEQEPRTVAVFQNFKGKVHGFRVNTLDNETDADEKALADQYKIYIQHTAIFLDKTGKEIKRTIGTQSNEQLEADLKIIAGS